MPAIKLDRTSGLRSIGYSTFRLRQIEPAGNNEKVEVDQLALSGWIAPPLIPPMDRSFTRIGAVFFAGGISGLETNAGPAKLRRKGAAEHSRKRIAAPPTDRSGPAAVENGVQVGPWHVRKRLHRKKFQAAASRNPSQLHRRRVICWRRIPIPVDEALDAENRIPGMQRDDDQAAARRQHTLHPNKRCGLIRKMFERADEQYELESLATVQAEFSCVADLEAQMRHRSVPLRV